VSQTALQEELDEAAEYVRSTLPPPLEQGKIMTDWKFIPSAELGGDAFGYHWIDDENFAIYLLDVCGHGVKAALLSISVINVLRSDSLSHTNYLDPSSVLESLNRTFPMEKNHQMFFTMWYGVYNHNNHTLTYGSGGHPPAFLIDSNENISKLHTGGVLIGGFDEATFDQETTFVETPAQLLVFSDGVFEIEKGDNSRMTFQEFEEYVTTQKSKRDQLIENISQFTRQVNGAGPFVDDFSLLHVTFY